VVAERPKVAVQRKQKKRRGDCGTRWDKVEIMKPRPVGKVRWVGFGVVLCKRKGFFWVVLVEKRQGRNTDSQ